MLDKQDITLLQDMMDTTVSKALKVTLKIAFEENNRVFKQELKQELKREWRSDFRDILSQNNVDLKCEIRDEVQALIAASENRMLNGMESMKHEITDFLDQAILPQIHELQVDMALVKGYLKLA